MLSGLGARQYFLKKKADHLARPRNAFLTRIRTHVPAPDGVALSPNPACASATRSISLRLGTLRVPLIPFIRGIPFARTAFVPLRITRSLSAFVRDVILAMFSRNTRATAVCTFMKTHPWTIIDVYVMHAAAVGPNATRMVGLEPRNDLSVFTPRWMKIDRTAGGMVAALSCASNARARPMCGNDTHRSKLGTYLR